MSADSRRALATTKIDVQKLVAAFLSGRNKNTLASYSADIADFQSFLRAADVPAAVAKLLHAGQGAANLLVLEYKNALKERGLQSATINRRLSSIRAVVRMARMLGMVPWSLDIPNEKHQPYRDVSGVGVNGIEKIVANLRKRQRPSDIRNLCIIRLLFDLGLRRMELVNLDLKDVDLEKAEIWIRGKGRTQKEKLSLPEPTVMAIREWLAVRPEAATDALFLNYARTKKRHERISGSGIYKVIRWLGSQVNLKIRVHGIRHDSISAAVRASKENNILLTDVLKFSRHKSLTTLQVYVDSIENRQGEIASLVAGNVGKKR